MDVKNSLLDQLTQKHNEIKAEEATLNNLSNALAFYESFIPEFFSKTGEAKAITEMYDKIGEMRGTGTEKQIDCMDVSESAQMYLEYMEGMITFINDISNVNVIEGSNDLTSFTEKFNRAKEKDSIFIESLYDGKLTKITTMPVSEAVQNVEFLIDFMPKLQTMNSNCCVVKESINTDDENKKQLLNDCAVMLCESVNNFCFSTIHAVLDTYNSIQESLAEDSNSHVTENSGVIEYKLF
jgi:hypothetical protein